MKWLSYHSLEFQGLKCRKKPEKQETRKPRPQRSLGHHIPTWSVPEKTVRKTDRPCELVPLKGRPSRRLLVSAFDLWRVVHLKPKRRVVNFLESPWKPWWRGDRAKWNKPETYCVPKTMSNVEGAEMKNTHMVLTSRCSRGWQSSDCLSSEASWESESRMWVRRETTEKKGAVSMESVDLRLDLETEEDIGGWVRKGGKRAQGCENSESWTESGRLHDSECRMGLYMYTLPRGAWGD